jgi:hypothetical protein
MGQYYYATCIDKMEYLYSHDFDNGLKLMEHSYIGNKFVEAAERLLSPGGAWHKRRICWAGDYMDAGLFLPPDAPTGEKGEKANLHSFVGNYGKNALPGVLDVDVYGRDWEKTRKKNNVLADKWTKALPKKGRYLANHTKKVCLDLTKEKGTGERWHNGDPVIINPLPLLTCSGNGRGGGDYLNGTKMEMVGSWAGDVISLEHEPPYEVGEPMCFEEKPRE